MNLVDLIEKSGEKESVTPFNVGDTVKVHFKIVEGNKERIQVFEGLVIARKGGSSRETFTVRKISFGVGVERIFPVHSPRIEKIEVIRQGDVRRAKLYYIRDLSGKAATRVKEKKTIAVDKQGKTGKTAAKKAAVAKREEKKAVAKAAAAKPKVAKPKAPKAEAAPAPEGQA